MKLNKRKSIFSSIYLFTMRPPPRSVEEWLYRKLMDSEIFHHYVRVIHAKINNLPPPGRPGVNVDDFPVYNSASYGYRPTAGHKLNAFRILWVDEMKRTFGFKR